MTNSQNPLVTSEKRSHDWTGPTSVNKYVHCSVCGKIFEVLKAKGACTGRQLKLVTP